MSHDGSLILSDVRLAHARAGMRGVRQASLGAITVERLMAEHGHAKLTDGQSLR